MHTTALVGSEVSTSSPTGDVSWLPVKSERLSSLTLAQGFKYDQNPRRYPLPHRIHPYPAATAPPTPNSEPPVAPHRLPSQRTREAGLGPNHLAHCGKPQPRATRRGELESWIHALLTVQALPWLWHLERGACVGHHTTKLDLNRGEDWDKGLLAR